LRIGNPAHVSVAAVVAILLLGGCAGADTGSTPSTSPPPAGATTHAAAHHKKHAPKRHARKKHHNHQQTPAASPVPVVDRPNHRLTPGVAFPVTAAQVCRPGYAESVRDVPESEKLDVYHRYGVVDVPYAHEVDHLISLEIGGSNDIRNLWPEPYAGKWGARTKDQVENALHDLVCAGKLPLKAAQQIEAANWVLAYKRYVSPVPLAHSRYSYDGGGSGGGGGTGVASTGGYYTSSYPSAYTIYCADDPEWRSLSKHYLVHFPTLAAALKRFPGRHLHRPC
jgi:hypothetical protein